MMFCMSTATRQQWQSLPNEPPKAFAGFAYYLGLGPGRSIDKAHALYCEQHHLARPRGRPRHWLGWSARFHWPARAKAYDEHLDGLRRAARERKLATNA